MALNLLKKRDIKISDEAMEKGLKAQQPCRMEIHEKLP
jgi:hypothetical protein